MKVSRKKMKRIRGGGTLTTRVEGLKISSLSTYNADKVFNDKIIDPGSIINFEAETPYSDALD
jgi:hypothetical protein